MVNLWSAEKNNGKFEKSNEKARIVASTSYSYTHFHDMEITYFISMK